MSEIDYDKCIETISSPFYYVDVIMGDFYLTPLWATKNDSGHSNSFRLQIIK